MEHSKLKLEAIIVDTDHAFIVRLGTVPRSTQTGIANIIPQGIDRPDRDAAIEWAQFIVKVCNQSPAFDAMKEATKVLDLFVRLLEHPDASIEPRDIERAKRIIALANKTGE